jgi:ribosomal-protein-alanine N-acetyltransferase
MPRDRLTTERLLLRRWRKEDREAFAAMNADPVVMEHFPSVLSRERSDALMDRIDAGFDECGFGLWALETLDGGAMIGFAGLSRVPFAAHFTPAVEVGWRLARGAWGRGYATEAGAAAVEFGFTDTALPEIVSFTAAANERSVAVMTRLGMRRDPAGDFEHPLLPPGHRLRRHLLFRLPADAWRRRAPRGVSPGSAPQR